MNNNLQEFDVISTIAWTLAGTILGFFLSVAAIILLRYMGMKHKLSSFVYNRSRVPFLAVGASVGAICALAWASFGADVSTSVTYAIFSRLLVIAVIGTSIWWVVNLCMIIDDITRARYSSSSKDRSKRLTTQAQLLRRLLQTLIIIIGIILLAATTFPSARVALGSMLASAGVLSVIAGLAAQSVLTNTFAGLQIAFSDALRVGDMIVVDSHQGTIEEITLTYVVLQCWDQRRVILPSKRFTADSFENWTRRGTELQGTVELQLDWRMSMESIRQKARTLVASHEKWDGRKFDVQMMEANAQYLLVRVVVSAANSADLWQLRCDLREQLAEWVYKEQPKALAVQRIQTETENETENETAHPAPSKDKEILP